MDPFRDDRESLLARITQLEQELAEVRDDEKRRELSQDLARLARRVTNAAAVEPPKPSRSWGLVAIVVFMAGGGLVLGFRFAERPAPAIVPAAQAGADIPGFPHDVDPSGLVPLARAKSHLGPTARVTGIRVSYARSNGLVDLGAATYSGRVVYSFAERPPPAPPPPASAPLGAPAPPPAAGHSGGVEIDARGIHDAPLTLSWMEDGLPDPRCSIADVWQAAIGAGAPRDAVAIVEYGRGYDVHAAAGAIHEVARWKLEIAGTSYRYEVDDATCAIMK